MRNPFKKRGLPDFALHGGFPQHDQSDTSAAAAAASAAAAAPPPPPPVNTLTLHAVPPLGYPHNNNTYYHNNPQSSEPPTAYPYSSQPGNQESSGAVFEFKTGRNTNRKGNQNTGTIRVFNTLPGSPHFAIPQTGRFVFSVGDNLNEGDHQVGGNVEFANVQHGTSYQNQD